MPKSYRTLVAVADARRSVYFGELSNDNGECVSLFVGGPFMQWEIVLWWLPLSDLTATLPDTPAQKTAP